MESGRAAAGYLAEVSEAGVSCRVLGSLEPAPVMTLAYIAELPSPRSVVSNERPGAA